MTTAVATAADQLNLKVKSQDGEEVFSRSKVRPSSRNSWMPTVKAKRNHFLI